VSCPSMPELLHAYADGELDPMHTLEVEQHLQGCPACSRACDEIRALSASLQAGLPRFEPPGDLQPRIRAALRQGERRSIPSRWVALAASLAVLALGLLGAGLLYLSPSAHDRLVREVIASHIRSQMADHLLDVPSTDRHTVKPWFQGKLDFAPTVADLSADGFVLAGGRMDYVNGKPAAALVYRRRQHVINLLAWPTEEADTQPQGDARQGFHVVRWRQGGLSWWAVSDLDAGELMKFARLVAGR
jgi:anti-sigma factor RsiW